MPTGRTSLLTPEVAQAIVKAVSAGNPRGVAAAAAGVSRATLFRWLARGRRETEGAYRDLCDGVKKAEARAVRRRVGVVRKAAASGAWQAAAWWLERRYPDEFGGVKPIIKQLLDKIADLERKLQK